MMSVRALFVVGRNRGVADRDDKRARKARTAVVRGVGRAAFDVHVVTAVTAIPLKSVLLVVLNGEIRAILQVGLIVVAEIDGMNVASAGAIHGKRSVIERERGILACAHRHPIPLGGIRDGTNAGHACIDVLKHERLIGQKVCLDRTHVPLTLIQPEREGVLAVEFFPDSPVAPFRPPIALLRG